ncbi:hypothetical protein PPACK8108_LOCUS2701 [Phakopsora pachyrhizi]|uniref:Uncharacterized protein n=1 Tax=Phakopsora pachyrhizi TaxID=170000 RepID=A0AAV0AK24_PHAPC|nr:hypothetical protein PPACK8108_LOCUS2701 [Phakopsora pachyrhizi]
MKKKLKRFMSQCQSLDMTILVGEQVRKPTNKKQEVEDTSGVICVDGLVVSQEAQTDRLDYDLMSQVLLKLLTDTRDQNEEAKNSDCITGSRNENTTRKNLRSTVNQMKKKLKRSMSQCQRLDMTVLVDEQVRKPTNEKLGGVLNEDQSQGVEDTSGVICVDGLVVRQEARTDRLDYDLSRWEPEEYEYLKSRISNLFEFRASAAKHQKLFNGQKFLKKHPNLFREDPINQHELEHNNRIREGRPIVSLYRQNSPRVHQTDTKSPSLFQPSIESRFNSGENQVKENTGFGDLGNNSGLMGAISDIYSSEHPNIAENLLFKSSGDHLYNNFNENFNHIIGGTHPEQSYHNIPKIPPDIHHDPEQDNNFYISNIQGNHDYQLNGNYVGKIQIENYNALEHINNYQNYDSHLQNDRSIDFDKIYSNYITQDYGIYRNQNIVNVENQNHDNGGQSIQDHVSEVLNPSQENTLHLNVYQYKGPGLIQNVDVEQNSDKKSMKEKDDAQEYQISRTEKSYNEGGIPTIYSDMIVSHKPQHSGMKLNYYNSAGAHSQDTKSSSFYWPGIEARLSSRANEALDKSLPGDLGSSSGHIRKNSSTAKLSLSN